MIDNVRERHEETLRDWTLSALELYVSPLVWYFGMVRALPRRLTRLAAESIPLSKEFGGSSRDKSSGANSSARRLPNEQAVARRRVSVAAEVLLGAVAVILAWKSLDWIPGQGHWILLLGKGNLTLVGQVIGLAVLLSPIVAPLLTKLLDAVGRVDFHDFGETPPDDR